MLSRTSRSLSLLLLPLLTASLVAGQGAPAPSTPPTFSEQIEVNVVNVDVYVADAQGHPVTDLKREDFQLFEDGKPVELTNFYAMAGAASNPATASSAIANGAPATPATDTRPEEQRLSLVVFVDDVNTGAHSRNRVLGQLQEFLKRELTPGDRVMLIRFQSSLDVRRPFTTDISQVQKDIAALETLSAHGGEEASYREANQDIMADAAEAFGSGCDQALEAAVKSYADYQNHVLDSSLRALDSVVSAVAPVPGRKAILYVGEGMSANPGFEGFQALGACNGKMGSMSGFLSAQTYDSRAKFNDVTGHASRNRVAFYTLETSASQAGVLSERDAMENRQESLRRLAEGTGGRAMLDTADARRALSLMAADLANYYSLGYRPSRGGDGIDHKIEVKLKRKGAIARYRQWYRDKPQTELVADRTGAALLYGIEDNPLGMRIEIGRQVPQGDLYVVPVRLHVPLAKLTLLQQEGARVGHVRFFVVASGNGEVTPVRTSEADVRIPEALAAAALKQDYVHEVRIKLKRGPHALGIGLRDDLAATASYLKGNVDAGAGLPAPAAAAVAPARGKKTPS
jgi:VWFA-related protein